MLKQYQEKVVDDIERFFSELDNDKVLFESSEALKALSSPLALTLNKNPYSQFPDRPITGTGEMYPRVCIKMPTGGGKTLVAVETVRAYQNILAKKKTGLVVWIVHREQIYRQTIQNLQNKSHFYRQMLDQASGNRTLVLEKGQALRKQDVEENLVVLMMMIQSASRDTNKIFEDSGGYTDFFPEDNRYDKHAELLEKIPNLDKIDDTLFERMQVKTSLGNVIRTLNPLMIVDEMHTMWTDNAKQTLDGLNPSMIIGLSATPKKGMNIISTISGRELKEEEMIKLPIRMQGPTRDWEEMLGLLKKKRDDLEKKAEKHKGNEGAYIRPIAVIQVERTGRDQRGQGKVHSEDVREALIDMKVPAHCIAVKSSSLDEIKEEKLLSSESEIRYVITKDALKEGWDCSFAYLLGVIPNAQSNNSMTQLVGRILRQPYARKTGVPELDESYVFYTQGHTEEVLKTVKKGLESEGLEDMVAGIEVVDSKGKSLNPERTVKIKPTIKKKYSDSLFLPVWLVKENKVYRRFSYHADIEAGIEWDSFDLNKWYRDIKPSIGSSKTYATETSVDLDGSTKSKQTEQEIEISFDALYLTRRVSDTIKNAFVANDIAHATYKRLVKDFPEDVLSRDAGYVARELEKALIKYKKTEEKELFENLVKSKTLMLGVSDDEFGFQMPEHEVVANSMPSSYENNLYEDVDVQSLNTLEREVVKIVDSAPTVLWWSRNRVARDSYAIQGWQKNKIRPDFIVAKKDEADSLELVYVLESKGEHLVGNEDTEYKAAVFDRMNELKDEVESIRLRTTTVKMNNKFEFELIPEGENEKRLRTKLNA